MTTRRTTPHWPLLVMFLLLAALALGSIGSGSALAECEPGTGRIDPPPPDDETDDDDPRGDPPPTDDDRDGGGGPPPPPPDDEDRDGPPPPRPPVTPPPGVPEPTTPKPTTTTPQIGGTRRARPKGAAKTEWSWTTWWSFNRWNYLPARNDLLRRHFLRFRTITGEQTDAFHAWDRRRDELAKQRAVPALINLMNGKLSPGDEGIRAAAAIALARASNEPLAVASVMKRLEDPKSSHEVREAAAFAAGLFRRTDPERRMSPEQSDILRKRLFAVADNEKNSSRVRCLALLSIGILGDQPNSGRLPQGLRDIHGLWKRLTASDQGTELHVAYLTALGLEPAASSGATIKDGLKDIVMGKRFAKRRWNAKERSHALSSLIRIGGPGWRPVLTRLFSQKRISTPVRRAAFITLGDQAGAYSAEERKELVKAWDAATKYARDPLTKGLALIALGRILAADLEETEGGTVIRTTRAADTLLAEARGATQALRGFAVMALTIAARNAKGGDRLVVRLRGDAETILRKGIERNAGNAASLGPYVVGSGILQSKAAIPALEALVLDSNVDPKLRGYAAVALGQIGRAGPSTVKALKRAVADHRLGNSRLEAALGLAFLTGDRDSAFLRTDIERRRYTHSHQIGHVAIALGQMGDLRAVDPLCSLLLDKKSDHGARGAAAVALGLLCDPEERSSLTRLWKDVNYPARTAALHRALNYL